MKKVLLGWILRIVLIFLTLALLIIYMGHTVLQKENISKIIDSVNMDIYLWDDNYVIEYFKENNIPDDVRLKLKENERISQMLKDKYKEIYNYYYDESQKINFSKEELMKNMEVSITNYDTENKTNLWEEKKEHFDSLAQEVTDTMNEYQNMGLTQALAYLFHNLQLSLILVTIMVLLLALTVWIFKKDSLSYIGSSITIASCIIYYGVNNIFKAMSSTILGNDFQSIISNMLSTKIAIVLVVGLLLLGIHFIEKYKKVFNVEKEWKK